MSLRGFGVHIDLLTGRVRNWYAGEDGVQRWDDNDQPCTPAPAAPEPMDDNEGASDAAA